MISAGKGPKQPDPKSSIPQAAPSPLQARDVPELNYQKFQFAPSTSMAGKMAGMLPEKSPIVDAGQPGDPKKALELLKRGAI